MSILTYALDTKLEVSGCLIHVGTEGRARVTTASVDMDTLQKRRLPEEWRERFALWALREADFPLGR